MSLKREIYAGKIRGLFGTREDWKRSTPAIARGTFLGFFMGILPGVGIIVPTILSYVIEKRLSKHPERFGAGEVEGVAAPEACNNAALGGTFIPLLSLGIPSSGMTAMLLVALMIFGLQPGPLLIKQSPDLFWGVIASMYVGNIFLLFLNLPLIPMWVQVLKIPYSYLFSLILLFCVIGVYSLNNSIADIAIMIFFAILGFTLEEFGFELPPLILGFILGPMIETALRRSLIMSEGSFSIFLERPISAAFLAIAFIGLILPIIRKRRPKVGYSED
jgi:putative tricarboxylic transport membrane protein